MDDLIGVRRESDAESMVCWRCHYCGKTKIGKRRAVKAWNKIRR